MGFGTTTEELGREQPENPSYYKSKMERSNSEERDQLDRTSVRQEEASAPEPGTSPEAFQSDDWSRASPPASDCAEPVTDAAATEVAPARDAGTADVYFCGRTNLFPLNLAIRAI